MARILLGWELGAGRGHISRLLELAALLEARGHTPLFAPQQIGPFAPHGPTWQAPVWPRLLEPLSRRYARPPATMGDILAYLGLDDREAVTAMLLAWDRVLADASPDAVVADYAPMLQLAAKGRVPVVACGTGFSLPPHDLPRFPSFIGEPPVRDEGELLAGLNQSLSQAGREPLSALPQILTADRNLVSIFRELDPYAQWRRELHGVPALSGPVPMAAGDGDELFIYFNGAARRPNAFWQAVADSGLPARVHDPLLGDEDAATLERAGIRVERAPVAFADIARRSRLLLSHGGAGILCSGLLAGLPQIAIPFDIEKRLNAEGASGLGLCRQASFDGLVPGEFAAFLRGVWDDVNLRERARAAAREFRGRVARSSEEEAAEMVEALV